MLKITKLCTRSVSKTHKVTCIVQPSRQLPLEHKHLMQMLCHNKDEARDSRARKNLFIDKLSVK